MSTLLAQCKAFSSPLAAIPLLGTAADVAARLKGDGNVDLMIVSEEIKVTVVGSTKFRLTVLLDSDHSSVYELSAHGSNASTLTHYGTNGPVEYPTYIINSYLDLLHRIRQNFY